MTVQQSLSVAIGVVALRLLAWGVTSLLEQLTTTSGGSRHEQTDPATPRIAAAPAPPACTS